MLRNIGALLLLSSILFISCQSTTFDRKALRKEVMDIHDEMMVHFIPIQKAQKDILAIMNDAENPLDDNKYREHKEAFAMLQDAERAMRGWMNQWNEPTENMSDEEVKLYLDNQKEKVEKMKIVMETNINSAKKIFNF